MANEESSPPEAAPQQEQPEGERRSMWSSAYNAVRRRPVTTLTVAAGVGALAGAELLAAGLLGGAAAILMQRKQLSPRVGRVVERARRRMHDMFEHNAATGGADVSQGESQRE